MVPWPCGWNLSMRTRSPRWLEVWEQFNAAPLAERGMRPLPADIARNHQELAEQPLLLLMLALYDADTNALQYRSAELSRTELYGRLLQEFAGREIRKHYGTLPDADLERAVDAELFRLSVVAFAMFNRRSQWVSEADLDADLSMLLGVRRDIRRPGGLQAPLTSAQLAIGRFFFVHESQATRDGLRLQTYEFLHATFGEFLVARLVVQVLTDVLKHKRAGVRSSLDEADDALLHALLSFAALTARGPVVAFLGDQLEQMEVPQRAGASSFASPASRQGPISPCRGDLQRLRTTRANRADPPCRLEREPGGPSHPRRRRNHRCSTFSTGARP